MMTLFVLMLSLRSFASYAMADTVTEFRSGENQTHLIELFSSEGCSSCPPADSWLASLRARPDLWKQFVPIEFHVDYWNRLGWTDHLSKSIFTERQQSYAREWVSSSVYTPGFVLDGKEWRRGGASMPWGDKPPNRVGILSAKRTGKFVFQVSFDSSQALSSLKVYAALLGNGLESKVNAGENSGTVLKHEFAVISLTQKRMDGEKTHHTATVELPPPHSQAAKSYSAAFWVSAGNSQKPLQVVGGDLGL
jgi:hypothetical protein